MTFTSHPHTHSSKRVRYGDRPYKPGLYLGLLHGRHDPKAEMNDWGFHGPAIGPLKWCHTTYVHDIKIEFETAADQALYFDRSFDGSLTLHSDMVEYEGCYYGDWTVYYVGPEDCAMPNDTFRATSRQASAWGKRAHRGWVLG